MLYCIQGKKSSFGFILIWLLTLEFGVIFPTSLVFYSIFSRVPTVQDIDFSALLFMKIN